jgi:hypothetical protein
MAYLVQQDGKTLGPFSRQGLERAVATRELAPADLACDEYSGRWQSLSELLHAEPSEPKTIHNKFAQKRTIFSALGWGGILAIAYFFYRVARLMHTWVRLHPHI